MIILYARQKKRHRCIEQTFRLYGRRWGRDVLREQHQNMYIIKCETDHHSRFDAWYRVLGGGALEWPREMGWGGRWEWRSGWGTHVNPWLIHVNVWQKPLQYCKVISLQLIKINGKKGVDYCKQLGLQFEHCPNLWDMCVLSPPFRVSYSSSLSQYCSVLKTEIPYPGNPFNPRQCLY